MGPRPKVVCVKQRQKWALHVEKQLMQMMFSNNSIQAALGGREKTNAANCKRASRRANGQLGSLHAAIQKLGSVLGNRQRRRDNNRQETQRCISVSLNCKHDAKQVPAEPKGCHRTTPPSAITHMKCPICPDHLLYTPPSNIRIIR